MAKIFKKLRLKKHKDVVVLFAVILISTLLYAMSLDGAIFGGPLSDIFADSAAVFYKVVDYPINAVGKFYNNYINVLSVKKESKELKIKINKLRGKLYKLDYLKIENAKLKSLLSIKKGMGRKTILATVVFHGVNGWFNSLYIDKGAKNGVKVGEGVISYSGVIGRIVTVGKRHSRVIPVTDPRCSFSVIDANTGTMGIAQGLGNGFLKMRFVFTYKKIKDGDDILTSGLGGIFSAGLLVGKVYSVKKRKYKMFQKIFIIPQKNLFNSNHVLIEK